MSLSKVTGGGNIQFYTGIEGYLNLLLHRIEENNSDLHQLIDASTVAEFHKLTDNYVELAIGKRVEKGIKIYNLVDFNSKDRSIEKSDSETLKEARYLDSGINYKGMLSIYGDFVSYCNLSSENLWGFVIKDKTYSESSLEVFWRLWSSASEF